MIKKNIIPIIILLLGITILLVALLKKEPRSRFTITPQEMLSNLENVEHVTNMDAPELQQDTDNFIFVDLRSPYEFEVKHIENSINIPTAFLLDVENITVFEESLKMNKTVVLYGQIERDAVSPWFLLHQMGMTNTKILYGGFECLTENKAACPTGYPRYNYAKISTQGGIKEVEVIKEKPKAPLQKKKEIPIVKKVKQEAEGGC